jgi:hypothetical protein
METIYYLIVVFVMAFIGGMVLGTGRARRTYLRITTVLFVITVVGMGREPYLRFVKTFGGGNSSPAVQLESQDAPVTPVLQKDQVSPASFTPFYVYKDKNSKNHFTPSGFMPDGNCVSVDDAWQYGAKEGRSCISVVYDVACSKKGRKWIGLYWQNPANNWGSQKGGYNLKGATKLVFWARGHYGGEVIREFKVGGLGAKEKHPDSAKAVIGPVTLTKEWQEYTIDLRGKNLSSISGGFAWSTNVEVNSDPCIFYLDDIRFE